MDSVQAHTMDDTDDPLMVVVRDQDWQSKPMAVRQVQRTS